MISSKTNFYFITALVTPKMKYRLLAFSKTFKPKISQTQVTSSFWKSLTRFSYQLSTKLNIKLATLTKVKNKIFIKNFIFNLFTTNNWLSFGLVDLNNIELRSIGKLKKFLTNLISVEKENLEIFLTNWALNKIFKNFLYKIKFKNSNFSFFYEKYFFSEKYTRAVGVSNNLKFFILKFFTFFIKSNFIFKQIFFLNKKFKKQNFLFKLRSFKNLFLNKWFFLFFNTKLDLKFNNILIKILNSLNLVDYLVFTNGFIVNSIEQTYLYFNRNFFHLKTTDNSFINFFIKSLYSSTYIQRTNSRSYELICSVEQKSILKINYNDLLSNSFLFLNKTFFYFFFIFFLNKFLLLKIKIFSMKFSFKLLLLKCQHLNN